MLASLYDRTMLLAGSKGTYSILFSYLNVLGDSMLAVWARGKITESFGFEIAKTVAEDAQRKQKMVSVLE